MSEQEQAAEHAAGAALRLPEFWPETPASWFIFAESKFRLKNITSGSPNVAVE
jgi:hypothetical protein